MPPLFLQNEIPREKGYRYQTPRVFLHNSAVCPHVVGAILQVLGSWINAALVSRSEHSIHMVSKRLGKSLHLRFVHDIGVLLHTYKIMKKHRFVPILTAKVWLVNAKVSLKGVTISRIWAWKAPNIVQPFLIKLLYLKTQTIEQRSKVNSTKKGVLKQSLYS